MQVASSPLTLESNPAMKAIRIHAYGGPEVLRYEDAPDPQPATDELLVKIHAASVNPVDWKVREGHLQRFLKHRLPLILGWDVAGEVVSAGAAVTGWSKGDAVYARPDLARDGSYAEFMVLRATEAAPMPKSLDFTHAAAVPLAALTAWQSLFDAAGLTAGQRVLIHAGAGGVGAFAVQLAHHKGAHVIATGSQRNAAFIRDLGADEVIDYHTTRFEEAVHDLDVVFDTVGGEVQDRSWSTLRRGGFLVSVVRGPAQEVAAQHGVRAQYVFVQPNSAQLREIGALIDAGKILVTVETVLPLAEAAEAQKRSAEGHTRGKIILRVREGGGRE